MKNFILISVICLMFGCSLNGNIKNNELNDSQIRILIHPSGSMSETYSFVIDSENKLIAEKGEQSSLEFDITKDSLINVVDSAEKELSAAEIDKIQSFIKELYADENYIMVDDSWDVEICIDDKVIKQNYFEADELVRQITDEIISLSSIEVDLHSWS